MSLQDDRVLIETWLRIAAADRRRDGGWVLWHDTNRAADDIVDREFWRRTDAAIRRLHNAGWLIERLDGSGLVTVFQPEHVHDLA